MKVGKDAGLGDEGMDILKAHCLMKFCGRHAFDSNACIGQRGPQISERRLKGFDDKARRQRGLDGNRKINGVLWIAPPARRICGDRSRHSKPSGTPPQGDDSSTPT
ncbi:hypothetical protein HMPREF3036_01378 [Sutterella sp. KLE1602]|nr:hypothetical protein HMPREF3036_01378 [Sutterella sp. KLE1602]